jgi:FAD:protein FMN transferase
LLKKQGWNKSLVNQVVRKAGYCFLGLLLFSASAQAEWHSRQWNAMGTRISLQFWMADSNKATLLVDKVQALMLSIDERFSPYRESSEPSQVNREAAKAPVAISDELYRLLERSLYYSELTSGAFDITFASVGHHYDYRQGKRPSDELLKLSAEINYRGVQLNPQSQTVYFAHPDIRIDLGGIAKGYSVDLAIDLLREQGVKHAAISAGGDSRLLGDKLGRPWMVGVKNPRAEDQMSVVLPLQGEAISTSGDYERFFIDPKTEERVHHILNPRSGRSAGELMSVTILGPDGFDTDPLSTSVFVLGLDEGLALINRMPSFETIIIDRKGVTHYSNGLMSQ